MPFCGNAPELWGLPCFVPPFFRVFIIIFFCCISFGSSAEFDFDLCLDCWLLTADGKKETTGNAGRQQTGRPLWQLKQLKRADLQPASSNRQPQLHSCNSATAAAATMGRHIHIHVYVHNRDIGQTLPNCANHSRLSILSVNVVVWAIFPFFMLAFCFLSALFLSHFLGFLKYATCLQLRLVLDCLSLL